MNLAAGRRAAALTAAAVAAVALSACGTRVSRDAVIAGAGGGPVTFSAGAAAGPAAPSSGPAAVAPSPVGLPASSATGPAAVAGPGPADGVAPPAAPGSTAPATTPPSAPASGRGTAPASASGKPAAGHTCTHPGSTIVYGQVGTFSGIIGATQGSAQPGLKVWALATNAAGGIACHPVQVYSIDDAGDVGRARSATQELVENDHAVAINAAAPVTADGVASYVDSHDVPVVGGDLVTKRWTADGHFFPQGSSFEAVIFGTMRYAATLGGTKYALMYCIEASPCTEGKQLVSDDQVGEKAGLVDVADIPISIAGTNFSQQCQEAKSKGADVVFIGGATTTVQSITRDCAHQNYHPLYVTEALAVVNSIAKDPDVDGLIISSTVFPYTESSLPGEVEFQAAIQKYAPSLDVSGAAASSWVSGELLKKAILSLGDAAYGDITPAMITKGLKTIKGETLGGLAPSSLDFTGPTAVPDRCAFVLRIQGGAFTAPLGNKQICEP